MMDLVFKLLAFIGLQDYIKRWVNEPNLEIFTKPEYRTANLGDNQHKYKCCRITIKNAGKTAATNCIAKINKEKVAWVGNHNHITININDTELVDFCAFLFDEYKYFSKFYNLVGLNENVLITKLLENNIIKQAEQGYYFNETINSIHDNYWTDWLDNNLSQLSGVEKEAVKRKWREIPGYIVSPTENGYGSTRKLLPGDYEVLVTSDNAKSKRKHVTIHSDRVIIS